MCWSVFRGYQPDLKTDGAVMVGQRPVACGVDMLVSCKLNKSLQFYRKAIQSLLAVKEMKLQMAAV